MASDTIVIFHVETSGLDLRRHEIIQVAAAAYSISRWKVIDTFERKIEFDLGRAAPEALHVNGYDEETWRLEAVDRHKAWKAFDDFLNAHRSVRKWSEQKAKHYMLAQGAGYNATRFAHPWVAESYKQRGAFLAIDYKVLDVMQLMMWHLKMCGLELENDQLETVCHHFKIEYDPRDLSAKVLATARLIGKLAGRADA